MPYPRGIKTPEVRAAWLAERREKVAAFDQLVAQGAPRYRAAQAIGSDVSSLDAMRRSIEQLEEGGHVGRSGNSYIDLGLSLLQCLRKPGEDVDGARHRRVVRLFTRGHSSDRGTRLAKSAAAAL